MANARATMNSPGETIRNDSSAVQMLRKVYLKDLSFESPRAPGIFTGELTDERGHEMHINVRVTHDRLREDEYEVAMRMTAQAIDTEDNTLFLAEVEQAGLFSISDIDGGELEAYLKVHCPRVLYPFARQMIWTIVSAGGLPGLLLQDFDFDVMNRIVTGKQRPETA